MGIFHLFKNKSSAKSSETTDEYEDLESEFNFDEPTPLQHLLYRFTHVVLRDAVLGNDCGLIDDLDIRDKEYNPEPLVRFWKQAMLELKNEGILFETESEQAWEYYENRLIQLEQHQVKGHQISLLTLPEPQISPEAYMVAMVHKAGDAYETNEETVPARYFTLEFNESGEQTQLCEWEFDRHVNYGEGPVPDKTLFINAIADFLD